MPRVYVPKVGEKVKLRTVEFYGELDPVAVGLMRQYSQAVTSDSGSKQGIWDEYTAHCAAYDVPDRWVWLEVLEVEDESRRTSRLAKLRHVSRNPRAPDPAWEGWVELSKLEPPLGWQPSYTIYCKYEAEASRVVADWFARGIHVWASQDLSSAGRMAYTPVGAGGAALDDPASPHWQFSRKPIETVPAEQCRSVFTVKVLEEWEPTLPPSRKGREATIRKLRDEGVQVEYLRSQRMYVATRETLIYQSVQP